MAGAVLLAPQLTAEAARAESLGSVVAWGWDDLGQLGNGAPYADHSTLVPVTGLGASSGVVAVAAGSSHSLAIHNDGSVLAWGSDNDGALGDGGTSTSQSSPVGVTGLGPGSGVVAVAAGSSHSLALRADGSVVAWGDDRLGQLGDGGANADQSTPVAVSGLSAGSGVVAIAAGSSHSLALRADGTAFAWGNDNVGQLGDGGGPSFGQATPVWVSGLGAGSGVVAIAAGRHHSLALRGDGSVVAWGWDGQGQLGDGGANTNQSIPVAVSGLSAGSGVEAIAAGASHSLGLGVDGVVAWGDDTNGQLGDGGSNTAQSIPVGVSDLGAGSRVVAIAAGADHSLALGGDGTVLAWGGDSRGQLGDGGSNTAQSIPVGVSDLGAGSGVVAIAAGGGHSLALRSEAPVDGASVAWGRDVAGQLGDGGGNADRSTPVGVSGLGAGSGVLAASAGSLHSLVVRADGSVLSWGSDFRGQLGDGGANADRSTPVAVSGLGAGSGVVSVAAGREHSLALRSDGSVLSWGSGQSTPVAVSGLGTGSGVVAIAAGAFYSLALRDDGGVLTWGSGQSTPVAVSGLGPGSGVVAIAAGAAHSLVLRDDGGVVAWGSDSSGQLGDGGVNADRSTPVAVSGLGPGSGVVAIAAGQAHSLALRADGSTVAWGSDFFGQLGDGDPNAERSTPVGVSGLGPGSGVVDIAAGQEHSLVLREDGGVLAWGGDSFGGLGDGGANADRSTPVAVSGLGAGSGVVAISAGGGHSLAVSEDTAGPEITVAVTGDECVADIWRSAAVTISADEGASVLYGIDGAPTTAFTAPFSLSGNGTTVVNVTATDQFGNRSTVAVPVEVTGFVGGAPSDDFNRADGVLGPAWGFIGGRAGAYRVEGGQAVSGNNAAGVYAAGAPLGVHQEAFSTLVDIREGVSSQNGVLLKVQPPYTGHLPLTKGGIGVFYNPNLNAEPTSNPGVVVRARMQGESFQLQGIVHDVTFVDGDQIGAQIDAAGEVKVYRNCSYLGSVQLQEPWATYFATRGGASGVIFKDSGGARFDDFGNNNLDP